MATTRKTTKSTAKKTVPSKKPAKKPAGASVKPKSYKTVSKKTTAKTTKTTAKPATASKASAKAPKHDTGKVIFVIILALAMLALGTGLVVCAIQGGSNTVVMENGNGDKVKSKYVDLDGFKVAIPTSFKKSDESTESEIIYANDTDTVVVAISKSNSKLTNEEVKRQTEVNKSILKSAMDDVTVDYIENDGHTIGIIRAINDTSTSKAYAEIAIFSYDDKLVTVTFESSKDAHDEWEKVGNSIVRSIRFKD